MGIWPELITTNITSNYIINGGIKALVIGKLMCKSPFAIRLHPRYPISLKLDRCPYFIIISRFDFKLWCCDTKEKTNYLPYFAGGIPRIGLPLLDFVVLHGKVIMN